ncbi:MAG: hypothetical protein ACREO9_01425 [Lysobacterales bacterium]
MLTQPDNPVIANEGELYVTGGGGMFRLMQRIGAVPKLGLSVRRRTIGLILITWAPMCVFALIQGVALGPTPEQSFLLDFATYVRFFIGLPVLIYAERWVGPRLAQAGLQFVRAGFVRREDYPAFERAIARMAGRRESELATLVIIALAAFGAWQLTFVSAGGSATADWQSVMLPEGHAFRYNLAGLWSHLVALPVLLFLWYRWLWRILFWTLFLFEVSRLNLRLVPTHADAAGGLGFLETAHMAFGVFTFSIAIMLSAEAAFRIVYEGAHLEFFQAPALIVLALTLVVSFGPLLVFMPVMARTRREALKSYGSLVIQYNRSFEDKWLDHPGPKDEPLLGSSDIQSMADLGNSFRFIMDMRYVPFGRWAIVQMILLTLLPVVPLLFLAVPLNEILDNLAKLVL